MLKYGLVEIKMSLIDKSKVPLERIFSLYENPLPSTRSGALYNAFSYPTKISSESIAVFIATHTKPGDSVLDVFGGSGSTGLAVKLCDKPTLKMKELAEEIGVNPVWGPRKGVIYEISVLGSLISGVMCNPPPPDEFKKLANELIDLGKKKYQWLWDAEDPDGNAGELRHIIWTDILLCPSCKCETKYWDAAVKKDPLKLAKNMVCANCGVDSAIDSCGRAKEKVYDKHIKKHIIRKKRVMARVFGVTHKSNWQRPPLQSDLDLFQEITKKTIPLSAPEVEIEWGDLHRSGYHLGITHLHHFYTGRNFLAMSYLWDLIDSYPVKFRPSLQMLLLSYNSSHSTLMSRVVVKKNQQELVLTGAQSGVLYISGLPVEKNIFRGISKKVNSLFNAFSMTYLSESEVVIKNNSSEKLDLKNNSIDYVFTDPPFGDYIPYAEINQINEGWLNKLTERKSEIIISCGQGKGVDQYSSMMKSVFQEITRVMKKNALATVVFHSASSSVWKALTNSYLSSGLAVVATSVLDKVQSSFKQTVSNVTVKGDPLLLLSKNSGLVNKIFRDEDSLISEVLDQAHKSGSEAELESERLYSRFINLCLINGIDVPLDAHGFYSKINGVGSESK
jgi:16S rRNA G966 N2-methylase RsmD